MSDSEDDFEEQLRQEAIEKEKIAAGQGQTKVDEDGTVMEWDADKKAWFPKIDDDFMAKYQMNYGNFSGTDQSKDESEKPASEVDKNYEEWFKKSYMHAGQNSRIAALAAAAAGSAAAAVTSQTDSMTYYEYYDYYYKWYSEQEAQQSQTYTQQQQQQQQQPQQQQQQSTVVKPRGSRASVSKTTQDDDDEMSVEEKLRAMEEKTNEEKTADKQEYSEEDYKRWWNYYYGSQANTGPGEANTETGDDEKGDYSAEWAEYYKHYYTQSQADQSTSQPQQDKEKTSSDPSAETASTESASSTDQQEKKKKKVNQPAVWFEMEDKVNTNVYVAGLPDDITIEEYTQLMNKCGMIMYDPRTRKPKLKLYRNADGTLKGDGLCCYIKSESVELALQILDGYDVKGFKISVEKAKFEQKGHFDPKKRGKKLSNKEKKALKERQQKLFDWRPEKLSDRMKFERVLIVKNLFLPEDFERDPSLIPIMKRELEEECKKYHSNVRKVVIHDRHADRCASVTFGEPEEADVVKSYLDGRYFKGRQIKVETWDGKTKYTAQETEEEEKQRLAEWHKYLGVEEKGKMNKKEPTSATREDEKMDTSESGEVMSRSTGEEHSQTEHAATDEKKSSDSTPEIMETDSSPDIGGSESVARDRPDAPAVLATRETSVTASGTLTQPAQAVSPESSSVPEAHDEIKPTVTSSTGAQPAIPQEAIQSESASGQVRKTGVPDEVQEMTQALVTGTAPATDTEAVTDQQSAEQTPTDAPVRQETELLVAQESDSITESVSQMKPDVTLASLAPGIISVEQPHTDSKLGSESQSEVEPSVESSSCSKRGGVSELECKASTGPDAEPGTGSAVSQESASITGPDAEPGTGSAVSQESASITGPDAEPGTGSAGSQESASITGPDAEPGTGSAGSQESVSITGPDAEPGTGSAVSQESASITGPDAEPGTGSAVSQESASITGPDAEPGTGSAGSQESVSITGPDAEPGTGSAVSQESASITGPDAEPSTGSAGSQESASITGPDAEPSTGSAGSQESASITGPDAEPSTGSVVSQESASITGPDAEPSTGSAVSQESASITGPDTEPSTGSAVSQESASILPPSLQQQPPVAQPKQLTPLAVSQPSCVEQVSITDHVEPEGGPLEPTSEPGTTATESSVTEDLDCQSDSVVESKPAEMMESVPESEPGTQHKPGSTETNMPLLAETCEKVLCTEEPETRLGNEQQTVVDRETAQSSVPESQGVCPEEEEEQDTWPQRGQHASRKRKMPAPVNEKTASEVAVVPKEQDMSGTPSKRRAIQRREGVTTSETESSDKPSSGDEQGKTASTSTEPEIGKQLKQNISHKRKANIAAESKTDLTSEPVSKRRATRGKRGGDVAEVGKTDCDEKQESDTGSETKEHCPIKRGSAADVTSGLESTSHPTRRTARGRKGKNVTKTEVSESEEKSSEPESASESPQKRPSRRKRVTGMGHDEKEEDGAEEDGGRKTPQRASRSRKGNLSADDSGQDAEEKQVELEKSGKNSSGKISEEEPVSPRKTRGRSEVSAASSVAATRSKRAAATPHKKQEPTSVPKSKHKPETESEPVKAATRSSKNVATRASIKRQAEK